MTLEYLSQWPHIQSGYAKNSSDESEIERILALMTLEEKVAQMIQPEMFELTPEDAGKFKFGSALNGAGIWPGGQRHAKVADWVNTVNAYWQAVNRAFSGRPFRIPFMWASDAVHGHNNVYGATIFPHNIGLGAASDPALIRRIGAATALELAVTGMDWTFAPTVTTPRDYRWGRHYEGYSEDGELVYDYAGPMVEGLQGSANDRGLEQPQHVISCVKHWLADGGTRHGIDRGNCHSGEDMLRNVHAAGYYSGLAAGAQSVMVSFSGWVHAANYDHSPEQGEAYNFKLHGSRYLIHDILKRQIGFDGLVISDWDAHSEVSRCSLGEAGYAINAGIDVLMIAQRSSWHAVYHGTLAHVRDGLIPLARIDDAVTRILRVKMRAGLWDKPEPCARPFAGREELLGCAQHRALSREAVRKSLVLLKNDSGVLPLPIESRVLLCGSGIDDIQKQVGGWTLSWQGNDVTLDDLPGAKTLAMAVGELLGEDRCRTDPALKLSDAEIGHYDVAVVAIGEDAYAEMRGTIRPWRSVAYQELKQRYRQDVEILRRLRARKLKIVTILFSGRPLYVTEELNLSDAFVAAWLPGTEAGGIVDLLFAAKDGQVVPDFTGRLSFSWPARKRSVAINRRPPNMPDFQVPSEEQPIEGEHRPLFEYGYGLSYARPGRPIGPLALDENDAVSRDAVDAAALAPCSLLDSAARKHYRWMISGHNTWSGEPVSFELSRDLLIMRVSPFRLDNEFDALEIEFKGFVAFIYVQVVDGIPKDRRPDLAAGAITFDVLLQTLPEDPIYLCCHDDYPAQPGWDITPTLREGQIGNWQRVEVPLARLAQLGMDFRNVNTPFMLYSEGNARLCIARVQWLNQS